MTEPAVTVAPASLNSLDNSGSGGPGGLSAAPKDRRQYTCLCGTMHLRTAALCIGAAQKLALIIALITVIVRFHKGQEPPGSLIVVVISAIVYSAGLVCLFLAVRRQFPRLLLPYFAVQAIAIAGLLIYAVVLSSTTISSALSKTTSTDISVAIAILVVVLCATALNTWFTIVVAKYYHFLRGQV